MLWIKKNKCFVLRKINAFQLCCYYKKKQTAYFSPCNPFPPLPLKPVGTRSDLSRPVETCYNLSKHVSIRSDLSKPVQICPDPFEPVGTRSDLLKRFPSSLPLLPLFPSSPFFWGGGGGGRGREAGEATTNAPRKGGGRRPPPPSGF